MGLGKSTAPRSDGPNPNGTGSGGGKPGMRRWVQGLLGWICVPYKSLFLIHMNINRNMNMNIHINFKYKFNYKYKL